VSPFGEVAQCKGRSLKRGRDPDPVSEAWRSSIGIEGGQKHITKTSVFPPLSSVFFSIGIEMILVFGRRGIQLWFIG